MDRLSGSRATAPFGRRVTPRACVIDNKPHIRTFLIDMLDELGFIAHGCTCSEDMRILARDVMPELVVLGVPGENSSAPGLLIKLAAEGFRGKVMLFGGRAALALVSTHELGEKLRLEMLPPLGTPFRDSDLTENLSAFLPIRRADPTPVDVGEALGKGWLELWYQPKIDPRLLKVRGAEALIRMRHPVRGVVLPSYFLPDEGDRYFRALSEFVVRRAMTDWSEFAANSTPVEIAVNLPLALLGDRNFVEYIRAQLPVSPAFPGLMVEVDSAEIVSDPKLARETAKRIAKSNIRISVEDVAAEGSSLARMPDFPFSELKVDWKLVESCGEHLRKAVCAPIIDLAGRNGAQAVAVGIETRADLQSVCDLGFGLVQGFLFGQPMDADKFARSMRSRGGAAFS